MTTHTSLVQLDRIVFAISEVKTIQEVKGLRDKAEAMRIYAKQANYSLEIQNDCAEIKIRAERKAGDLLREMPKSTGAKGIGKKVRSNDVTTLSGVGVSKNESSRWQRVASVPDDVFETHVVETKEAKRELTTASMLKIANSMTPKNGAVKAESHVGDFVTDLSSLTGKKFGCLYVDPPWKYSNQATRASTDNHYDTMTVDDICAMPIRELAADKSHLHLWTTNAFLF